MERILARGALRTYLCGLRPCTVSAPGEEEAITIIAILLSPSIIYGIFSRSRQDFSPIGCCQIYVDCGILCCPQSPPDCSLQCVYLWSAIIRAGSLQLTRGHVSQESQTKNRIIRTMDENMFRRGWAGRGRETVTPLYPDVLASPEARED